MEDDDFRVPFVTKFSRPIISWQLKMMLLRYEFEDGSKGCIGIREEALETLYTAFKEILDGKENFNNPPKCLGCSSTSQPIT